jgi:peroxidase
MLVIHAYVRGCGFLQGCDASVLLKQITNGPQTERQGFPNLSLRGFEVIDAAKTALEEACPGVVSCSDILAFAARDASKILSSYSIDYLVPAGRYDGKVSFANETLGQNLPPPFADVALLIKMFADKGLNKDDMVVLSGAHTIGDSHCSSFSDRVHPPTSPSPSMNSGLAASLNATCHTPNNATTTVPQDSVTPNALDNQYYRNVKDRKVLFTSDDALNSAETQALVEKYADAKQGALLWNKAFGDAMVKMGNIGVKTSREGEIRKECGRIN